MELAALLALGNGDFGDWKLELKMGTGGGRSLNGGVFCRKERSVLVEDVLKRTR